MAKVVDFHHHVTPPEYIRVMSKHGIAGNTGVPFKKFNPSVNQFVMKKTNIDFAYLSISTPGVYLKDDSTSASVARIVNDYIGEMVKTYPGKYGGLGALPFPAVKESLKEIEYIFDVLKLPGICVLSDVQGTYFGEPGFDELFQELNRRKALVFIHPEDLFEHKGIYLGLTHVLERSLCTTRSAYNLLLNGYLEKYPDIKFILSHGGGAVPVMADKIVSEYFSMRNIIPEPEQYVRVIGFLRNLFFDTAQRGYEVLNGLKAFCGSGHIVFGSDLPYIPPFEIRMNHKEIAAYSGFSDQEKTHLYAGNRLSENLKSTGSQL